jgi:hypothetical protein
MPASSVTGLSGPGMSHGVYKPENTTGCNCGSNPPPTLVPPPNHTVCAVRIRTAHAPVLRTGQSPSVIHICV